MGANFLWAGRLRWDGWDWAGGLSAEAGEMPAVRGKLKLELRAGGEGRGITA